MPIDFPNSPTAGDSYSAAGKTWTYDGTTWVLYSMTSEVPNGSVTTAKIANAAITTDKIATGAVVEADIADGAVTMAKYAAGSVGEAALKDSAITQAKLASTISAITICTSTTTPATPFTGQTIYATDTDEIAVWEGSYWENLNRSANRNIVINGSMAVAQRGTTSTFTTGYLTADRWQTYQYEAGSFTQSISSDYPSGTSLRSSWNLLCTTARTSLNSMTNNMLRQTIEGQNLQHVLKGSSSAKKLTLSFWIKSNKTGTYIVELHDEDQPRHVSGSYTIFASDTWERKSITFPANTTGSPFDNDTNGSLTIRFHFSAGSTFTSGGTLNTAWDTVGAHQSRSLVGQVNLADTLNNYLRFTGVQLEAGSFASPFEFEDYEKTLNKCRRYYLRFNAGAPETPWALGYARSTTVVDALLTFPVPMRIAPTAIESSSIGVLEPTLILTSASLTFISPSPYTANLVATASGLTQFRPYFISNNGTGGYVAMVAEF